MRRLRRLQMKGYSQKQGRDCLMAKRAIARPVRIEWPDPSVMKKGTKRTKRKKMTTNWLENDFRMVKTSNFFLRRLSAPKTNINF